MKKPSSIYQKPIIPSRLETWWLQFYDNKLALIALILLVVFIVIAMAAPLIAPFDPAQQFNDFFLPPFWYEGSHSDFLFGTDDLGRDIFSRLIYGARLSLQLALMIVLIASVCGVLLGSIAALSYSWIDQVILRLMDLLLALPSLLLAIAIVAIIGPGLTNAIYAVVITLIPQFVLITRSMVLRELNKEYVTAMQLDGASKTRLFAYSIFPNIAPALIIQLTIGFSTAIFEIAALGFIGLGAQAPTPEWGTILYEARNNIVVAPWTVTLPGLAIFFVLISINLIGDGLRDSMNQVK